MHVGAVQTGRADPDEHLPLAGHGIGVLLDDELLVADRDGTHRDGSLSPRQTQDVGDHSGDPTKSDTLSQKHRGRYGETASPRDVHQAEVALLQAVRIRRLGLSPTPLTITLGSLSSHLITATPPVLNHT
jgi:hypothetical protein